MAALLLFWPALAVALALLQGPLLPAIRRTPPGAEANAQRRALHGWGLLSYALPLALAPWLPLPWWAWLGGAVGGRLLFDPILNVSSGRPAGYVGQTAATDQLLRRLAPAQPERLALLLRATVLLALQATGYLLHHH